MEHSCKTLCDQSKTAVFIEIQTIVMKKLRGWIPNFNTDEFFYGEIWMKNEKIVKILEFEGETDPPGKDDVYILPGLVDAHVHIESSMLTPSGFAHQAVRFGTVATVSDPHEIANVLGSDGVKYMFQNADLVPLKIHYTAPSCVPATEFEESGAVLNANDLQDLARVYSFVGLGEMMNFPGVVGEDPAVVKKIELFKNLELPIDGHAPQLRGADLKKYVNAGISTDHEATDIDEALEKIALGMKILIREGSAARNFEDLWPLIESHNDRVMLCCDDIHPDELLEHHIDHLIKRGLRKGLSIFDLLRAASLNPVKHYNLDVGTLKEGDRADFIIINNIPEFKVEETYIDGVCVYSKGKINFKTESSIRPNSFNRDRVDEKDFLLHGTAARYKTIGVIDGDLYTTNEAHYLQAINNVVMPDNERDIVRIAVVNRYRNVAPSLAWIKNTGLKRGALASSVAHDSHNIVVMGVSEKDMADAVNLIVDNQGGISYSCAGEKEILPLPVAGLMSDMSAEWVGKKYEILNRKAWELGSSLKAPFMTLSFMALLVIPELKIGDKGLFDVKEFKFVEPLMK